MQADARAAQDVGRDKRDDDSDIGEEAVRQENGAEPAELVRKRQLRAEAVAGGGEADGGRAAARELGERTAEEVAHTDAEGGQRKAGDVLIGAERDREEAVDQPHHKRAEERAAERNEHRERRVQRLGRGERIFIQKRADDARDAADIHDAGDAEVEVTGFFGEDLAGGAEQQRNALHDGAADKFCKNHFVASLCPRNFSV